MHSLNKTKHNNRTMVVCQKTVDKVVKDYIDIPDEEKLVLFKISTKNQKRYFGTAQHFYWTT